jgi:hypothetical protein
MMIGPRVLPLLQMNFGALPVDVMEILRMFFTTVIVIALGIPIVRAVTRRFERGPTPPNVPPPDVVARLQRIEQAVDSVAIEVERIAEAQRFSAKLQAEQAQRALPPTDR